MKTAPRLVLLTVFFFAVYWISAPENRTETDDGYEYAIAVRSLPYGDIFLNRCLLFQPFVKVCYDALNGAGIKTDAYELLCLLSCLFSSLSLALVYFLLSAHMKMSRLSAAIGTAITGFSYGFWRYAMEADLYPMATFMILLVFIFFMKWYESEDFLILLTTAVLASVAVLVYKLAFIPLFIALPALFLIKRSYKQAIVYCGLGGILILAGHFIVFKTANTDKTSLLAFVSEGLPLIDGGNRLKFLMVVGSNFLSTNWIYGFSDVMAWLINSFPNKFLVEEAYIGRSITWERFFSLGSLIMLGLVFVTGIFFAFVKKRSYTITVALLPLAIWILLYGSFLLVYDPFSQEPWLMLMAPLSILFTVFVVEPNVAKGHKMLMIALASLFFLYNYVGGMLILQDAANDYFIAKSASMLNYAQEGDVILTCEARPFGLYLRYRTLAEIPFNKDTLGIDAAVMRAVHNNHQVLFSDDLIVTPPVYKIIAPEKTLYYQNLLRRFEYDTIHRSDFNTFKLGAPRGAE